MLLAVDRDFKKSRLLVPWVRRRAEELLLPAEVIGNTPDNKEPEIQMSLPADRLLDSRTLGLGV